MEERYIRILELLTKLKKADVTYLSEQLNVSTVTIRKDLDHLEERGLVKRSHGYATLNSIDNIHNRLAYHYDKKREIAMKAIEDVQDGETVMIESGSCCALVALLIAREKTDCTIITNSAFIAEYVSKMNVKIYLLGGEYQKESQVNIGPMVGQCVKDFHVDKFFLGADGFTQSAGFTGKNYERAQTVRSMMEQATHCIVVSESEKFGVNEFASIASVKEISTVYTDEDIPADDKTYLESCGIKVIVG